MRLFILPLIIFPAIFSIGAMAAATSPENAARELYRQRRYRKSIRLYRQELEKITDEDYRSGIAFRLLAGAADNYLELRKPADALKFYLKAAEAARRGAGDDHHRLEVYENIMLLGLAANNPVLTVEYGVQMLELIKKFPEGNHFFAEVNCHCLIADAWMSQGQFDVAAAAYRRAETMLAEVNGKTGIADIDALSTAVQCRLAVALCRAGLKNQAVDCLRRILAMFELRPELADPEFNPETGKAFEELLKNIEIPFGVDADEESGRLWQEIAVYYLARKEYPLFTRCHRKAVRIFRRLGNEAAQALSRAHIARSRFERDPESAAIQLRRALRMTGGITGKNNDAAGVLHIAGQWRERNNEGEPAAAYYLAAAAALESDKSTAAAEINYDAGRALEKAGENAEAAHHLRLAASYGNRYLAAKAQQRLITIQQRQE